MYILLNNYLKPINMIPQRDNILLMVSFGVVSNMLMSNRLWIAMLTEWREKFSERKGIHTMLSYKGQPLRKTVFSIYLGWSLYVSLTVYAS